MTRSERLEETCGHFRQKHGEKLLPCATCTDGAHLRIIVTPPSHEELAATLYVLEHGRSAPKTATLKELTLTKNAIAMGLGDLRPRVVPGANPVRPLTHFIYAWHYPVEP